MEVKEQIKRNVSITDVVSLYVDLRPSGKYLKALCPFHTEKTPSFHVMPEKDSFACFGCNTFGDIFTFIQEIENLSFPDAMKFLVDKFNIPIEQKAGTNYVKKDLYQRINELALKYFRSNLFDTAEGKNAQDYLKQRGILPRTIDEFQLGYAMNQWDGLEKHLKRENIDLQKSIELGLLIRNTAGRVYDRFRGRIIFPIFSESGTPIAFGGRTIFDEPNKYLNSPDTPLYKKSNHLYGYNLTKNVMREKKSSVLVEGYFDVVSMFQHGVQNVAASLGTALTEKQISLLKRFSEKIYIFYDSDRAGIAATVRGIELMFSQNINPGIITVGGADAKDPDDFIRLKGTRGFNRLQENATDGFRFLVDNITKKYDTAVPEQKNDAIRSIMSYVDKISEPIIRNEYVRMVADYFKVDEALLKTNRRVERDQKGSGESHKPLSITPAEGMFLTSLLALPQLIGEIKELMTDQVLTVLVSKNIIRSLVQHFNPETRDIDDYKLLTQHLNGPERALLRDLYARAHASDLTKEVLEERLETAFLTFHELVGKEWLRRIQQEIKIAERQNNVEMIQQLLRKKAQYTKQKTQLKYEKKQSLNIGGAVD